MPNRPSLESDASKPAPLEPPSGPVVPQGAMPMKSAAQLEGQMRRFFTPFLGKPARLTPKGRLLPENFHLTKGLPIAEGSYIVHESIEREEDTVKLWVHWHVAFEDEEDGRTVNRAVDFRTVDVHPVHPDGRTLDSVHFPDEHGVMKPEIDLWLAAKTTVPGSRFRCRPRSVSATCQRPAKMQDGRE